MKTRESGMPDEDLWASFFTPEQTLAKLGLTAAAGSVLDLGCGYGTFAVPAARLVAPSLVHALDIDPAMLAATARKAQALGLSNLRAVERDFMAQGAGLPDASVGFAMLFNILHSEDPWVPLREAWRVLRPGGLLAITHWNPDPATPRGPSMDIRPRPEACLRWAIDVGFTPVSSVPIDLPPHHFGLTLTRGS